MVLAAAAARILLHFALLSVRLGVVDLRFLVHHWFWRRRASRFKQVLEFYVWLPRFTTCSCCKIYQFFTTGRHHS